MSNFNLFRHRLSRLVAALAALWALAACSVETDDTLGANLVPDNQQMKAGYLDLGIENKLRETAGLNPRKYVETRLYQTDSIVSSNISYGYFGSMRHEQLGRRTAGFLTQYTNYYTVDSGYFGYRPIFDSALLTLSIAGYYGGDTTQSQTFALYEIVSNDYLKEREDSVFYLFFDPVEEGIVGSDPLFTFTLGGDKGPATTSVTLEPTDEGRAFVQRLFLESGNYKGNYSIYSRDSIRQWLEEFKGFYIAPLSQQIDGAIYATALDASAFTVYGRNRRKDDPALIQDTVGMSFYFIDPYAGNSNVSINSISHNYEEGDLHLDIASINESVEERPQTSQLIIEGLGGAVSELTFTQEFFDRLDQILADEKAASKKEFSTLAFSQAMIYFYFPSYENGEGNYSAIDPAKIVDQERYKTLLTEMDDAQSRLGLYTSFKKLSGISDYAYAYEQQYSTTLTYDGYINRSHACYAMNISGYMQQLWNSYRKERDAAKAEGRAIDLDNVKGRTLYLGPEAYSAYTLDASFLQGSDTDTAAEPLTAPIRLELTYNMIR